MGSYLNDSDLSHIFRTASNLDLETRFPAYIEKLPSIKTMLPSVGDSDLGQGFILAEAVGYDSASQTPRIFPLEERTSPWHVTLESIIWTGDNPSGLVFIDTKARDRLIIGPNDSRLEHGMIRNSEIFQEDNDDFNDKFLKGLNAKRKKKVSPLFTRDNIRSSRIITSLRDNLALLSGRVAFEQLKGIYGEEAVKNTIKGLESRFVSPITPDSVYLNDKEKNIKDLNGGLEIGTFMLVEGNNGIHIYEVVEREKNLINPKRVKPEGYVAVKEYEIVPDENKDGFATLKPKYASDIHLIKENSFKGRVFINMEGLLKYLPDSRTNIRHFLLKLALVRFCEDLLL